MRPFLDFPNVESQIEAEIARKTKSTLLSETRNGNRPKVDVLTDYLGNGNRNERLQIIVGMSGGSLEKLRRIFEAIYPTGNFKTFLRDDQQRRRIASFLIDPGKEQTFIPPFIHKNFILPKNWINLLRNRKYLLPIVRNTMAAKYSVWMGHELEREVNELVKSLGLTYEKGPVDIVDGKEVDVAIPNRENPTLLVMSSYSLTTSSAQTTKANEQMAMYQKITSERQSRQGKGKEIRFVNIIDGGGWLARTSDLEHLWKNCDYCFPYSRLTDFKALLEHLFKKSTLP